MRRKRTVRDTGTTRLVWGEWAAILVTILYMLVLLPPLVSAQINEPVPDDLRAPAAGQADFAVIGDSQGSFGYVWPVAPVFDNVIGVLNQIDVPMVFHVGDFYVGESILALDVEDQADRFLDDIADLKKAWFPVMGNHDSAGDGWEITREKVFYGGETFYSFDACDSHFVVLDAFMPGQEYAVSGQQLTWLEDDLIRNTRPHVFVFVHPPVYSLGWHRGGCLDKHPEQRDRLASLLVEHGVDVVFNGHEHSYASFAYKGLRQVTTGGAGGHLRDLASFDELITEYGYDPAQISRWKTVKTLHYVLVSTADDAITVSAYDLEGKLIDRFVLPP